jgi:hypothetical protein
MQLPSQMAAVVSCIDPDAYGANTYTGDAIDMSKFGALMGIVMAGDLGTSATLDYKLTAAETSGGTYYDITGKAITQFTQAGTDSDKQAIINLTADELAAQGNADGRKYRYVKESLTVATATSDCGSLVLGFLPKYGPASDDDLASVDEIKT